MTYLFNTDQQQREMCEAIGVSSVDELFEKQIPANLRLNRALNLPPPATEMELEREVSGLASQNQGISTHTCFMGGGAYDHFIPAAVDEVASRGEFYTAYTPYQAEASQGSLQAFFEFQTLICQLTGMDVANASLYEGGTAVSEAVFMAMRVTRRHKRVVVLGSVHPEYRNVVRTYLNNLKCELVEIPTPDGTVDPDDVTKQLDDQTACLVIQHPNFFGCLEDARELTRSAHEVGALSIVSFDPISLGVLERPGNYEADIAVAEGQPLGVPLQYGGPWLGLLTCREKFVRRMPGRLIGRTTDRNGRECFVLNLQAREQHIRRELATSNICTNQGLLALRATAYLSLLGPQGIREAAELCCQKSHYAARKLAEVDGLEPAFAKPFFKEFLLKSTDADFPSVIKKAAEQGVSIGPAVSRYGASPADEGVLIAVTEKRTKAEIDQLTECLRDR